MAQQFCVMTVGRSGSTSLMNYLEQFDDIALPCKDVVDCTDNELLRPDRLIQYQAHYGLLTAKAVNSPKELITAFYHKHEAKAYAGFKSMPNRHDDILSFIANPKVKIISLWREDTASTVASFMKAIETGFWQREGATEKDTKWCFVPTKHATTVLANLQYTMNAITILKNAPNTIKFSYEQLCNPSFSHPELNAFFGREVKIANPKPPTSAETYVENWTEFKAFIDNNIDRITLENKRKTETAKKATSLNNPDNVTGVQSTKNKRESRGLGDIMPSLASALTIIEDFAAKAELRKDDFESVQNVCLIVGYPLSGYSVVSALLDAHSEITIAQELDIARCINAGMNRNTIYHLLSENSRISTEYSEKWNISNYNVPNQYQGKTRRPKVIGDKKSGGLVSTFIRSDSMTNKISSTFQVPIKLIHVVSNPFDNIATLSKKQNLSLDNAAVKYFQLAKLNDALIQKMNTSKLNGVEIIEISYEDFVANPKVVIQNLVQYLGLTATDDYLQDCTNAVRKKPIKSRHTVNWTESQKGKVVRSMQQISFLKHYQFNEAE